MHCSYNKTSTYGRTITKKIVNKKYKYYQFKKISRLIIFIISFNLTNQLVIIISLKKTANKLAIKKSLDLDYMTKNVVNSILKLNLCKKQLLPQH